MHISTHSAMGRSNTPAALVSTAELSTNLGNSGLSTPAAATWTQRTLPASSHDPSSRSDLYAHTRAISASGRMASSLALVEAARSVALLTDQRRTISRAACPCSSPPPPPERTTRRRRGSSLQGPTVAKVHPLFE